MGQVFRQPLLATERTEFDTGAERLALAIALACGKPLAVVLPLASNPEFEATAPEVALRAEHDAATKLERLRQQAETAGVAIELRVRRGAEAWREIVDEARERAADLLVIRRRGKRSFLAKLMVGEMVEDVLAHAPGTVLVVPRDAAMWTRHVLVAVEPGRQAERLIALATAIALECRLPMSAVSVGGAGASGDGWLHALCETARAQGVAVDAEVLSGAAAEQILTTTRRLGADLIVMGVRGAPHAARSSLGRVAREVTGRAECPVLLVPPSRGEDPT
jgi:nucleotide-binding universal stress UspA family protein